MGGRPGGCVACNCMRRATPFCMHFAKSLHICACMCMCIAIYDLRVPPWARCRRWLAPCGLCRRGSPLAGQAPAACHPGPPAAVQRWGPGAARTEPPSAGRSPGSTHQPDPRERKTFHLEGLALKSGWGRCAPRSASATGRVWGGGHKSETGLLEPCAPQGVQVHMLPVLSWWVAGLGMGCGELVLKKGSGPHWSEEVGACL